MPSPRWCKVLRDVALHKSRAVLVVLAIVVGIAGAGAVLDAWSLLRRVTRGEFRASNPAQATLQTEAIDPGLVQRVRRVDGVHDAQARRTVTGGVQVQGGWRTAILYAHADFDSIRIGIVKPEAGAWPPPDGALVVEASSVEFAGVEVGDSLAVQIGDAAPHRLPVAGIARDVGLAPGWMEHIVYGFATPATLARLGAPGSFDELQIVVAGEAPDRAAVRAVASRVRDVVETTGRSVTNVDVPEPGRHIHAAQIDSLLFTQGAFGFLALLSSCILVLNLIAAMLAGQVREIGVMKAVGARTGQIAAMYLAFALALGLAASAIALPLAAILGRQYAQFTADVLNFDITGFTIPARAILVQLAAGVLLPVAAAAIPVARGCRVSPSEALRDFGITAGGRAGGRAPRSVPGSARPLLLSLRNAFRKRQRMALTLATLVLGGAVYIGALNLRAGIRGSVDLLFRAQRYDLGLHFGSAWPADSLEAALARVPGVARAEAWGATRAAIAAEDGAPFSSFSISAPPLGSSLFVPEEFQGGRWLAPGDGQALVVNRRLLGDEPRLAVGRELTLLVGGRASSWRVVGVVDTGPSPVAYTSRATLASVLGDTRVDRAVVATDLEGPATQLDLVQRVRAELEGRGYAVESSQLVEGSRRVMEDHMLMVAGFLGVMAQLLIVVGGLGLASTMSLAVLERTREIGVLRAIGARHGAILAMVQIEGLVVALLGWALALPLSVPMSLALGHAFGRIMLRVPVLWWPEPAGVVRWLVVVVAVSVAACAWPAIRATRIPTAAALAYE